MTSLCVISPAFLHPIVQCPRTKAANPRDDAREISAWAGKSDKTSEPGLANYAWRDKEVLGCRAFKQGPRSRVGGRKMVETKCGRYVKMRGDSSTTIQMLYLCFFHLGMQGANSHKYPGQGGGIIHMSRGCDSGRTQRARH